MIVYEPKLPAVGAQTRAAQNLVVDDADTRQMASDWANAAKDRREFLDGKRKSYVEPQNLSIKRINADYMPVLADYDAAIAVAKQAMLTYDRAQAARIVAAQAEADRIAAEARAEAEAQAKKLAKTDPVQAAELVAIASLITAPVIVAEKSTGTHTRKKWKARLLSHQVLCLAAGSNPQAQKMLAFDQAAANLLAVATKGPCPFPGVEFYEDESVVLK